MAQTQGRIIKGIGGFYYVETADAVLECKARGIFRKNHNAPLVGDRVTVSMQPDGEDQIEIIQERKNAFIRPPVSNIDQFFILSSLLSPKPNLLLIDRLIAVAESKGIQPILIFTKCDLEDPKAYLEIYRRSGFQTFSFSAAYNTNLQEIAALLPGKVSVFTGNSGVGKSTLLNCIDPLLQLPTGDISQKLGRGKHTTRHVELLRVGGGYVADTPGFSSLDFQRAEWIPKEELAGCFQEFQSYLGKCKFSSCSHTGDNGCAVLDAVENGEIQKSRYQNYLTLYEEVKAKKEWEMK